RRILASRARLWYCGPLGQNQPRRMPRLLVTAKRPQATSALRPASSACCSALGPAGILGGGAGTSERPPTTSETRLNTATSDRPRSNQRRRRGGGGRHRPSSSNSSKTWLTPPPLVIKLAEEVAPEPPAQVGSRIGAVPTSPYEWPNGRGDALETHRI